MRESGAFSWNPDAPFRTIGHPAEIFERGSSRLDQDDAEMSPAARPVPRAAGRHRAGESDSRRQQRMGLQMS